MIFALKFIWYQIFQFFFSIACCFLPWRQPQLLEGPNSVLGLPALIKSKGVSRVLVVTDAVLKKLGMLDPLLQALDQAGIFYAVFDGVEPNPSIENIEEARGLYLSNHCDALLAFGGGSAIDCAKAAGARIARPRRSVDQLGGLLRILKRIPLIFAVPTTAGTGSETTLAAVVTNRRTHHKYALYDPALVPRYAALDPLLTVGLPKKMTSTTGMDALTHAVEAYTNRYAPKYTQRLSEQAVQLIFQYLPRAYENGQDVEAREKMLKASFYAGAAFTRACVGYVHTIAHTLGGLYGTPHGLANAIILPYVMEDYGSAVYKKLARLADFAGLTGSTEEEKAKAFIEAIHQMKRDMDIPQYVDMIEDKDVPQIIKWALAEANPVYPVPVIWNEENIAATIRRIRNLPEAQE